MGSEGEMAPENADRQVRMDERAPSSRAEAPAAHPPEVLERNDATAAPAAQAVLSEKNPERKLPAEDPSAIIESLRARLLFERNSSKVSKQQAQQLARKVKELEQSLLAEVKRRNRLLEVNQKLVDKLQEAGIEVDVEDPQATDEQAEVKPNWRISRRTRSSDGNNMEGYVFHEQGSRSPRSDSGSSQRRAGRSCRTIRIREIETSELEIDEQVTGTWSKVGDDIVELAKLRDEAPEEGWVSRVVDLFESKRDEEKCSDFSDEPQVGSSTAEVEQVNEGSVLHTEATVNSTTQEQQQPESHSSSSEQEESENSSKESAGSCSEGHCKPLEDAAVSHSDTSTVKDKGNAVFPLLPHQHHEEQMPSSTGTRPKIPEHTDDDVEDILRALTIAKEQLRRAQMQPVDPQNYLYSNYGTKLNSLAYTPGYDLNAPASYMPRVMFPQRRQQQVQQDQYGNSVNSYVDRLSVTKDLGYFSPSRC